MPLLGLSKSLILPNRKVSKGLNLKILPGLLNKTDCFIQTAQTNTLVSWRRSMRPRSTFFFGSFSGDNEITIDSRHVCVVFVTFRYQLNWRPTSFTPLGRWEEIFGFSTWYKTRQYIHDLGFSFNLLWKSDREMYTSEFSCWMNKADTVNTFLFLFAYM